jgi:hypothetical protein
LAKAGVFLGKDVAELRQAIKGIKATSVTIGPFVITEDINKGVLKGLQQPIPLGEELICAWAGATLQISRTHHKDDVGTIDHGHQVRKFCLLLRVVGHIADDDEFKPAG